MSTGHVLSLIGYLLAIATWIIFIFDWKNLRNQNFSEREQRIVSFVTIGLCIIAAAFFVGLHSYCWESPAGSRPGHFAEGMAPLFLYPFFIYISAIGFLFTHRFLRNYFDYGIWAVSNREVKYRLQQRENWKEIEKSFPIAMEELSKTDPQKFREGLDNFGENLDALKSAFAGIFGSPSSSPRGQQKPSSNDPRVHVGKTRERR